MATRLNNLDMAKNEIQNARIQNLASAPSSPVKGQIYMDSVVNALFWYSGSAWVRADNSGASVTFGSPVASAVGDTAADGAATTAARSDHKHAREAFGAVTAQTTFGAASGNGSAATVAHSDHTHGTPSVPTINQLAAQTADYSAGGFKLTSVGAPASGTDAANKTYVDSVRQGMDPKESVKAASVSTQSTAAFSGTTLDGVSLTSGDRILLKDQSTASQNGIWTYNGSGAALTRTTDADASGEISVGTSVFVEGGTTNGGQLWVATATASTPWVPGTDSSTWTQFSGASPVTAGTGMTASGNVFNVQGTANRITVAADSVDIASNYVGQASITTLGTIATGVWNGTDVAVADGGTGASTAAAARANLGVAAAGFAQDIGDGSSTSIVVTHNLGTRDVLPMLRRTTTPWDYVEPDIEATSTNTVTYRFATAPTAAQYRAIIGTIAG